MQNGQSCVVVAGTHKGKAGTIEDWNLSSGGNVTITVREAGGARFKTLERNVRPAGAEEA